MRLLLTLVLLLPVTAVADALGPVTVSSTWIGDGCNPAVACIAIFTADISFHPIGDEMVLFAHPYASAGILPPFFMDWEGPNSAIFTTMMYPPPDAIYLSVSSPVLSGDDWTSTYSIRLACRTQLCSDANFVQRPYSNVITFEAVPEASSMFPLAIGLLGLGFGVRRRFCRKP